MQPPAVLMIGTSFVAAGCNTEKPVEKPAAVAEMTDAEKEAETIKNKDFIKQVFGRVSGGGLGKTELGNLAIHIGGGKYYELENDDLEKLVAEAVTYRKTIEKQKEARGKQILTNATDMAIKDRIKEEGETIAEWRLPENLKQFERERIRTVEEMKK